MNARTLINSLLIKGDPIIDATIVYALVQYVDNMPPDGIEVPLDDEAKKISNAIETIRIETDAFVAEYQRIVEATANPAEC